MNHCRLCGGETEAVFHARTLGQFDVGYQRCRRCGSLQTEPPYWLDEAYSPRGGPRDAGAVGRNLNAQAIIVAIARSFGMRGGASVLDFGGGSGLLCRLLRDRGFDARVSDSYAKNIFAEDFDDDLRQHYDICCAFEVAEHFADPAAAMARLLGRSAALCIIGTETYQGQGADWWYLNPASGQHVFFYTPAGMTILAERHQFHYLRVNNIHIFSKRPPRVSERLVLKTLLRGRALSLVRAYLGYSLSFDHAVRDFNASLATPGESEHSECHDGASIEGRGPPAR